MMSAFKSPNYMFMNAGNNFDTHPDYRHDMFNVCQEYVKYVSDIQSGKAQKFKDRAKTQNYWHTFERLAKEQDKFLEDDMINNTPGRGHRNYRRMEYDIPNDPSNCGKNAELDREAADERKLMNTNDLLNALKERRFSTCTTASAYGDNPIKQKDYEGQIKL